MCGNLMVSARLGTFETEIQLCRPASDVRNLTGFVEELSERDSATSDPYALTDRHITGHVNIHETPNWSGYRTSSHNSQRVKRSHAYG